MALTSFFFSFSYSFTTTFDSILSSPIRRGCLPHLFILTSYTYTPYVTLHLKWDWFATSYLSGCPLHLPERPLLLAPLPIGVCLCVCLGGGVKAVRYGGWFLFRRLHTIDMGMWSVTVFRSVSVHLLCQCSIIKKKKKALLLLLHYFFFLPYGLVIVVFHFSMSFLGHFHLVLLLFLFCSS